MSATGVPASSACSDLLLTDLYELNMLQAYLDGGMTGTAVFELFVRKLPPTRGFLVAAGLEQLVEFLETAALSAAELDWLKGTGRFSEDTLGYLESFRFAGDLHAVPEGTVVFTDEPIVRITAPLPQAQLLESRIINLLHFQTVIASKAARMVLAAPGKTLVDFGLRRAHGAEAGLLAARASYLVGFAGTATTPAERLFGIPIFGTMAHSFIQAHDEEAAAFEAFARSRPDNVVLLLDTYDTEAAARKVVSLAPRLRDDGIVVRGVRLDSGALGAHATRVRRILDDGGADDIRIFASGGLDESALERLIADGAPIDGFGIGTSLTTSDDAAALDCAYKLQEYAGRPRRKRSEGKATWPGRKQVFRHYDADGTMARDVVALDSETRDGTPLVKPVLKGGQRVGALPELAAIRDHAGAELRALPAALRGLEPAAPYPVEISQPLRQLAEQADRASEEIRPR